MHGVTSVPSRDSNLERMRTPPRRGRATSRLAEHGKGRWSVPWSDLMLSMFVLFVVLYLTERERPETVSVPAPEPRPVVVARPEPVASQQEVDLRSREGVELTLGRNPRIVLTSDLLFESGVAEVRPEALPLLGQVARVIHSAPPRLQAIRVMGHSDDVPIRSERYASNWELSASRAIAVARILIEEFSLPADRFEVSAHAHHRPRDTSRDEAARSRNRRVEILLGAGEPGPRAS